MSVDPGVNEAPAADAAGSDQAISHLGELATVEPNGTVLLGQASQSPEDKQQQLLGAVHSYLR